MPAHDQQELPHLSYATPRRRRSFMQFARRIWLFLIFASAFAIYFGVYYIRCWHDAGQWKVVGNEPDLSLGITCIGQGVILLAVAIASRVAPRRQSRLTGSAS